MTDSTRKDISTTSVHVNVKHARNKSLHTFVQWGILCGCIVINDDAPHIHWRAQCKSISNKWSFCFWNVLKRKHTHTNSLRFLLGNPLRWKNLCNMLTHQDWPLSFPVSQLKDNSIYKPRHMQLVQPVRTMLRRGLHTVSAVTCAQEQPPNA